MKKLLVALTIVFTLLLGYSYLCIDVAQSLVNASTPKYPKLSETQLLSLSKDDLAHIAASAVSQNESQAIAAQSAVALFQYTVIVLIVFPAILLFILWFSTLNGRRNPLTSQVDGG